MGPGLSRIYFRADAGFANPDSKARGSNTPFGFSVPEHHGDGLALPTPVQSGNLSLKMSSSRGWLHTLMVVAPQSEPIRQLCNFWRIDREGVMAASGTARPRKIRELQNHLMDSSRWNEFTFHDNDIIRHPPDADLVEAKIATFDGF